MPKQEEEKKDTEVGVVPVSGYHTLLTRPIRPPIRNWHEFLVRWNTATDHQRQVSLLHEGYTIPCGRWSHDEKAYGTYDRHIFYLTIAEGWADYNLLQLKDDGSNWFPFGRDQSGNETRKSLKEMRQVLALKAFDMLCLNFFKGVILMVDTRRGREFHRDWEEEIITDKFFPVIQNFFRVEKEHGDSIVVRNLSQSGDKSHNEEHAVNFLLNLAWFLWGWRGVSDPWWISGEKRAEWEEGQKALSARIFSARPWMIEVLNHLGRLGLLREWLLDLDKPCLAKLMEIAMRCRFSGPFKDTPVRTLDEACYLHSEAAWLLKEYELRKEVHAGILKAEQRQREREDDARRREQLARAKRGAGAAALKVKKLEEK